MTLEKEVKMPTEPTVQEFPVENNVPIPEDGNILQEVEAARRDIKTDSYQMSIGELISLYTAGDIKLNPAYQRLFRWDDDQKTYFIESLIIGIPIPPIFVAQKEDGKWDIVDGLQRVSTILQLTGELPDKPPLCMTECKYVPSIDGKVWNDLPGELQRIIKRSKLTVNIILTANSTHSQYEVFQRLNTGGLHLSEQEIRNCLIIMNDEDFYTRINEFKENSDFVKATPLSPEKISEEYRMELLLRYLIAKAKIVNFQNYKIHKVLVRDFIDAETVNLINNPKFNLTDELDLLKSALSYLVGGLQENTFFKYLADRQIYDGKFSIQVFEAMLPGFVSNLDKMKARGANTLQKDIMELCESPEFVAATGRGVKALKRFKDLTELSFNYFNALN